MQINIKLNKALLDFKINHIKTDKECEIIHQFRQLIKGSICRHCVFYPVRLLVLFRPNKMHKARSLLLISRLIITDDEDCDRYK